MTAQFPNPIPGPLQPPSNKPFFKWLTYLVLLPLFALSTTFFGCVSLICSLWDKSGRQQHVIAQTWAKSLLIITLSPVEVIGRGNLDPATPAVYVSNHLSYMDTPVLFAKLPFQFRILAKQQLWKVPFIGWHLNRSGQVPVDQTTSRSAISSLGRGVAALKASLPLLLFPEGGRSPEGHAQPFLSGAAWMAIRAQAPIVPVALVGTYELMPMHTYTLHPRPLKVIFGHPIPTTGLTTKDADALTQRLYAEVSTMYYEHSTLDRPSPATT